MARSKAWLLGSLALATVLLGGCGAMPSTSPGRVARVGYLAPVPSQPGKTPYYDALRDELIRLGYVEGRNIEYLYEAVGPIDDAQAATDRLLARQPDVVVASTDPLIAVASARSNAAATAVPIVIVSNSDVRANGIVASLRQPGGNITGLTIVVQLSGKRLELLKEMVPQVSRVAVLKGAPSGAGEVEWAAIEQAAAILGVAVQRFEVGDAAALGEVLATVVASQADGLLVCGDALLMAQQAQIVAFAAEHGLPAMYPSRQFVLQGGLVAYGPQVTDLYRRAAYYVQRVLNGTRPADMPIEMPSRFDLTLNAATAQALGLNLPRNFLSNTSEIVY